MSSKSRKYTNRSKSQELETAAVKSDSHGEAVHVAGIDIPDDVLHVPDKASPLRFILMILLVVVLLIIFVVPTAFQNLSRGGGDQPAFFTWERPGHGTESFDDRELAVQAQAMQQALQLDFFLGIGLGVNGQDMNRESMARLVVLDQLAVDAGVQVPEVALGKHLIGIPEQQAMFGQGPKGEEGIAALRQFLMAYPAAEPNIRRLMRIKRFLDMSGFAASAASAKGIVEQWENQHVELAFDYVAKGTPDFEDAARAELPADEDLEAWLMGLEGVDKYKRDDLSSPERRRIELISYREGADYTKLFESYPLPEGEDEEVLARTYYDTNSPRRFVADDGNVSAYDDEAVHAACLLESKVKRAMEQWLDALRPLAVDGGDPNLLMASNPLGLSYLKTELLTRDEMGAKPEFKDASMLSNAFFTPAGSFAFAVAVGEKGPLILRVAEVAERELPPFAEIREQVADLWVADRAPELGRERLDAIFEGFEVFVPELEEGAPAPAADAPVRHKATREEFAAALAAAGFESQRRDWLDSAGSPSADPLAEDEDHKFLNISFNLKGLEEGEVSVEFDQVKQRLYLVRCDGRRAADIKSMSPKDFEQYESSDQSAMARSLASNMDMKFLFEHFNLRFSEDSGVLNPDDPKYGKESDEDEEL